jgi:hypothetical protein
MRIDDGANPMEAFFSAIKRRLSTWHTRITTVLIAHWVVGQESGR